MLMVSLCGGYTSVTQHVYTLEGMLWLMVSLCGGYTSVTQHVYTLSQPRVQNAVDINK